MRAEHLGASAPRAVISDSDLIRPGVPTESRPGFRFEAGHPCGGWRRFFAGQRLGHQAPSINEGGALMPARRELTMRQLRQMLRLHHDGVSAREIGRTLGAARSTIQDNLERARAAGIGWALPAEWTDEGLEQRRFARAGVKPGRRRHTEPDWAALARELKRSGVNLMMLWEEYRECHPDGYGYSRFCDLYREFE